MELVSRDLAEQDINKWLDDKRVRVRKREENQETIESLIDAACDGALSYDEEKKILKYKLSFPIGEEGKITTLKFKLRISVGEMHKNLNGAKTGDERVLAYMCALTGQNSGIIKKMDTADYSLASGIVIFFL